MLTDENGRRATLQRQGNMCKLTVGFKLRMKYKKILGFFVAIGLMSMMASPLAFAATCGDTTTSILSCDQDNKGANTEDNAVWGLLIMAVNILTTGIGIAALGGLVYGAILYASAEDKTEQVTQAKAVITNVVIGLILFGFMWSLLNFLIPGGVFK